MSDIISDLPHVSCFRSIDIRNFLQALAIHLKRHYKVIFRYFISSEYGTDDRYTHRPHYHCLFFVYGDISPYDFSMLVSKYWKYGRTDGIPYCGYDYLIRHNVVKSDSLPADYLRVCNYVCKYVQKSCLFDDVLNKRLSAAMLVIANKISPDDPDSWLSTIHAGRVRSKLKREVCQFHRQSQHFGENYLSSLNINEVMENGVLYMPNQQRLLIPVPIPTYYKRKLFYDLVVVDGAKTWQLNELGIEYKRRQNKKLVNRLAGNFYANSLTYNLGFTRSHCLELADYVYNKQGRINGDCDSVSLVDKLPYVTMFNYVTNSDKERLGQRGLVTSFLGNSYVGYCVDRIPGHYTFSQFISKYVIIDNDLEKDLNKIYYHNNKLNIRRQCAYRLDQRLDNIYKSVRLSRLGH